MCGLRGGKGGRIEAENEWFKVNSMGEPNARKVVCKG